MVIVKWIKGFLNHPFRIIKSIYYRTLHKQEYLANKRLEICKHCEHREYNGLVGYYCGQCGCILENKVRLIDEKCDMNKW